MANMESEEAGPKLTEVVQRAQSGGFTLQCDFARVNAAHVSMAASLGFISTEQERGVYGRTWHATRKGKAYLEAV